LAEPLISNYCTNHCIYCGFNVKNRIVRKKLSLAEIKIEAEKIFNSGIRDIVILTGESGLDEEFNLIKESIEICRKYFDRISLEVFPMSEDQYRILFDAGADGVTVYQETYDRDVYRKVHPAGLKSNFEWRLETVDRAALAGARHIGIGALLGLSDPYYDLLQLVLHAGYILRRYPSIELSLSLPRIHSEIDKKSVVQADTNDTGYKPEWTVSDHLFVQAVCAMRVVLPTVGITLSTRESCEFRNGVIPLGVTRCSAGSRTEVGGYSQPDADNEQFKISDRRGIDLMAEHIKSIGYDPVFLDRERF